MNQNQTANRQALTPAEAIRRAESEGRVEIRPGVFLSRQDSFTHEHKNFLDVSGAPYWITECGGLMVLPVLGEADPILIDSLSRRRRR